MKQKLSPVQISSLSQEMAMLIHAGITVSEGLSLMAQESDGSGRKLLADMANQTEKGDSLSASIAAASILAKVTRDRLMEQYDEQYPQYGFAVHKGYGTKRHYAALREYGPCPIHRQTFLKKFYAGT